MNRFPKTLGLAGLTLVFSGAALAQASPSPAVANAPSPSAQVAPDSGEALFLRARQRMRTMDIDGALADLDAALGKGFRKPDVFSFRGDLRRMKQDFAGARVDYEEALNLDRDFVPALMGRGGFFQQTGNLTAALADFDRVVILDPKRGHFARANVYRQMGKREEALADYNQAERLETASAPKPTATVMYQRGDGQDQVAILTPSNSGRVASAKGSLFFQEGDYVAAERELAKALQANPNDFMALGQRASILAKRGDFAGAVADMDRAIPLVPNHELKFVFLMGRARWLAELSRFDDAIADCRAAAALVSDDRKRHADELAAEIAKRRENAGSTK